MSLIFFLGFIVLILLWVWCGKLCNLYRELCLQRSNGKLWKRQV